MHRSSFAAHTITAFLILFAGANVQARTGDVRMALVSDDQGLADRARETLPGGDVIGGIWILPELAVADPAGEDDGLAEPRRLAEGGGFTHLVVLEHRTGISWKAPRIEDLEPFVARLARVLLQTRRIETRLDVHLFDVENGRILTWYTRRSVQHVPLAFALWVRDDQVVSRQLDTLLSGAAQAITGVLPDNTLTPPSARPPPLTVEGIRNDPYWNSTPPADGVPPWTPGPIFGTGDRWEHLEGDRHVEWWKDALAAKVPLNAHAMWVTRDWELSWFGRAELQALHDAGLTPVLLFYYFGDDVSQETVTAQYERYRHWLQTALRHLATDLPVLVVLEPEFNNVPPNGDAHVKDWAPFAELMIRSAAEVRRFLPGARVGICPGDYRAYDLWGVLGPISRHMDFLAFQELWASTRPSWLNEHYQDVTEFALLFTTYLRVVYERPVLLAYLGISSYSEGSKSDWEKVQAKVWGDLADDIDRFRANGLFGVLAFAWYDDPTHVGYFGPAETSWGLVERSGRRKPAFEEFARLARRLLP